MFYVNVMSRLKSRKIIAQNRKWIHLGLNEHLFSKAGQPFNSLSFSRSSLFGGKRTLPLGIKILKTVIRSTLIYSLLFRFV